MYYSLLHLYRRLLFGWESLRYRLLSEAGRERWIERRLRLGNGYWLFILGCNNSGTTVLWKLLADQPGVRSMPHEGQFLSKEIPFGSRVFSEELSRFRWTEHHPIPSAKLRYDWACRMPSGRGGVLLEKSPPHSVRSRWLQSHFQPARFIILTRSPYAVCEGIRRRHNVSIQRAADHWAAVHRVLVEDAPFLHHHLWLSYEELCDDLPAVVGKLESFTGLPLSRLENIARRPLHVHNLRGAARSLTNLNGASRKRLSADQVQTINETCGPMMKKLKYETVEPEPEKVASPEFVLRTMLPAVQPGANAFITYHLALGVDRIVVITPEPDSPLLEAWREHPQVDLRTDDVTPEYGWTLKLEGDGELLFTTDLRSTLEALSGEGGCFRLSRRLAVPISNELYNGVAKFRLQQADTMDHDRELLLHQGEERDALLTDALLVLSCPGERLLDPCQVVVE